MLMLANVGWLRNGRSGLQANVSSLHGYCDDAALTQFVYCLARARKVTARAPCAVFVLRAQTVATICSLILRIDRSHAQPAYQNKTTGCLLVAQRSRM